MLTNIVLQNNNKFIDESKIPLLDNIYEFGSVFKPINVFALENFKKLNLEKQYDVHKDIKIHRKNIIDFTPSKKPLAVKDILKESSNRGAVLLNRELDCNEEYKYILEKLGLLSSTDLSGFFYSAKPKITKFDRIHCDTMSYGYGLSITPIHLINAYGKMITGNFDFQIELNFKKQQIQIEENLTENNKLNELLFYANTNTKNKNLFNDLYVAGKTGTADKIIKDNKIINVTHISYFPYYDPKYLLFIFMHDPKRNEFDGRISAGTTVKLITNKILSSILDELDLSNIRHQEKI